MLHSPEQTAWGIPLYMNTDSSEFMCFKLYVAISILMGKSWKLEEPLTYLYRNILPIKSYVSIRMGKTGTTNAKLLIIEEFFQALAMLVQPNGCTI